MFVPDKPVTLVIPVKDQKNKFVIGLGLDLMVLTWDWNTGFSATSRIASVDQDHPRNRFNDGKADANGRIWAGEEILLSYSLHILVFCAQANSIYKAIKIQSCKYYNSINKREFIST